MDAITTTSGIECSECQDKGYLDCDLGVRWEGNPSGFMPPCSNCRFSGGPECECTRSKYSMARALYNQASNDPDKVLHPPTNKEDNPMQDVDRSWQGTKKSSIIPLPEALAYEPLRVLANINYKKISPAQQPEHTTTTTTVATKAKPVREQVLTASHPATSLRPKINYGSFQVTGSSRSGRTSRPPAFPYEQRELSFAEKIEDDMIFFDKKKEKKNEEKKQRGSRSDWFYD